MREFFFMGGYAGYVWSSFAITFAVLGLNLWLASRRHKKVIAQIRRQMALGDNSGAGFKEVKT